MDVPKLIIVAEHDSCVHTEQWLKHLVLLAHNLQNFPSAMLQVRAKTKPELRMWAYKQLPFHPRIVINGTVEGYDQPFLHLPQSQVSKQDFSFGMSIHSQYDPVQYDSLSPLYYQLGPIFQPLSKQGNAQGLRLITETAKQTKTPIIAVGGITPQNTMSVLHAGAYGIASSGYIMQSPSPIESLKKLYQTVCSI